MNQHYIKFKLRHILKMAGYEPRNFKISSAGDREIYLWYVDGIIPYTMFELLHKSGFICSPYSNDLTLLEYRGAKK